MFDTINSIVSPALPQVPVFSKTESDNFLYFFVDKIKEITANLSPPTGYNTGYEPPPTQTWTSFERVCLHDITTLLNKMKPSSCPVDVLPTVLFKNVFDTTGPCITDVLNTSPIPQFDKLTSLLTCLNCIKEWLNDNLLQLNSEKTETLIIAPEGSVPFIKQHIGALGSSVKQNLRNLGAVFDPAMPLQHHSKKLIKNCFFQLWNISKIRTTV